MAKNLRRELGFWDAVATGIAAMVGAGIFVVSGIGAKIAGPAVLASFLIAGIVALFNALSSAELAAAIPREGGTYEYSRRLISPKLGFFTGWLFVLSKMLEAATVALAFGAYATLFLNIEPRLLATAAIIVLTGINVTGIRASTEANKIMALVKVTILAIFAFLGTSMVKASNFQPFAPSGLQGVLVAAGIIFFAYTGYARITTLGEEIKQPKKTIPRAIFVSLIITTILYIAVSVVGIGLIGAERFSESSSPIAAAAASLGISGLTGLVGFGAVVATLSVLLGDLLASSRTMFAMARNGDLPQFLSRLKNANPENSVLACAAIVLCLTLTGSLIQVATFTSLTILIYYAVTNLSSLKLPMNQRMFPRLNAVVGFVCCVGLALFLPPEQWIWTIAALALGAIYLLLKK